MDRQIQQILKDQQILISRITHQIISDIEYIQLDYNVFTLLIDLSINQTKLNQAKLMEANKFIFVKMLTGRTLTLDYKPKESVIELKQRVMDQEGIPIEQQRMIYPGVQLENDKLLSDYNIKEEATLHLVLRLSIGVFSQYLDSPFRNMLTNELTIDNWHSSDITSLIQNHNGNNNSKFEISHLAGHDDKLNTLIHFADRQYDALMLNPQGNSKRLEDLKIKLSREELVHLVQSDLVQELQNKFGHHDEIILRRCQAHGKMIDFHLDASTKTLQLTLNDDTEYAGGKLIFATQGRLHQPARPKGTISIHGNDIVHGVTRLESGVRYGLFLLRK